MLALDLGDELVTLLGDMVDPDTGEIQRSHQGPED